MSDTEFCIAAILLAVAVKRKKRKLKRKLLAEESREFDLHYNLRRELEIALPMEFGKSLKISKTNYERLLRKIAPFIMIKSTLMEDAITPAERLSLTLHFLGTGLSFRKLLFASGLTVGPQTTWKIMLETCETLIKVLKNQIILPSNSTDWKIQAQAFTEIWNFPNCLGALGGKHISITIPDDSASSYNAGNDNLSLVMFALVNALHEFIAIDVGIKLNAADNDIFYQSQLCQKLKNGKLNIPEPVELPKSQKRMPYVFVCDETFPLMENIMKPYERKDLEQKKIIFNYRLERAQRTIENAFGLMASRFRVLLGTIQLTPEKASVVILTCCYLHNFLLKSNDSNYLINGFDVEDTHTATLRYADRHDEGIHMTKMQPHRAESNLALHNSRILAKCVRNKFCNYFMNDGAVAWQDKVYDKIINNNSKTTQNGHETIINM